MRSVSEDSETRRAKTNPSEFSDNLRDAVLLHLTVRESCYIAGQHRPRENRIEMADRRFAARSRQEVAKEPVRAEREISGRHPS